MPSVRPSWPKSAHPPDAGGDGRFPGAQQVEDDPAAGAPGGKAIGADDMKSMEEMIKAAQQAAETIQKQMDETQGKLDKLEVEGAAGAVWSRSVPRPRAA
jgi:hypothetical protein